MKAAELFVKALENEGVEFVFGIPGEENLDFLEALRTSKIKLVLTRHEQAAGFMAATYGRLTGKTGVCLATLGPGAANFVTAACYATLGGMPMMMITGQKPIKKSKQGQFQIVDVVEMMRPITKFSKQIVHGNLVPSLVREAFRIAEEERPGAVHLEFPEDIAAEETDTACIPRHVIRRPVAEQKALDTAISMIQQAKHPLLLMGAGANRKWIQEKIIPFLQKTGLPFCNTQMGKGIIPSMHDQYIGTAALSDGDLVHLAIEHADLIVNIGHDVIEKPPFFMQMKSDKKVIHINFSAANVDEVYFPQHEVVGDIGTTLLYFEKNLEKQSHWDFSFFWNVRDAIREHIKIYANRDDFPLVPMRVVADVRAVMPDDSILCLDNGMYKIWFARNYRCAAQNSLLLDNALATMGAGLPSAIAAKLVSPEKKVMAVCGDGGFMMNSQELETAVRLKLDLIVLVLNDSAYGMIEWKQGNMGFQNFGLNLGNPNFAHYAQSYGAKGYRVNSADELYPLLQKLLHETGVHVVEIPLNYDLSTDILSKKNREKEAEKVKFSSSKNIL